MSKMNEWGPATVLILALTIIVALAGAAVTIVNPDALSFGAYLDKLQGFALAVGALAIGRGVMTGLTNAGMAVQLPTGGAGVEDHGRAIEEEIEP